METKRNFLEIFHPIFIIFFSLLFLPVFSLNAQAPDTSWTKTFGGSDHDWGKCVRETYDKGFIFVGTTRSFPVGVYKVYLTKTDSLGNYEYGNVFGGGADCGGDAVRQTTDDGYIVQGGWDPDFGAILLIKTDSNCQEIWRKNVGAGFIDYGWDVQQTSDEGYIITGSRSGDISLYKRDSLGDPLWIKTCGAPYGGIGYSILQTNDDGYIISGEAGTGTGQTDVILVKTDSLGDTLWTKTYGEAQDDEGYCVDQTLDGGFIISGQFGDTAYNTAYLIKTDINGDTLWTRRYASALVARSVQQTSDKGYIMAGTTISDDIWICRTDSLGDTLWTKTIGGQYEERGRSVRQTADGGYIIGGWTSSFGVGGRDKWLIKLAPSADIKYTNRSRLRFEELSLSTFPNPFTSKTEIAIQIPKNRKSIPDIRLEILDASGQIMKRFSIPATVYRKSARIIWNGSGDNRQVVPAGVYFVRLSYGNSVITQKLLKIR